MRPHSHPRAYCSWFLPVLCIACDDVAARPAPVVTSEAPSTTNVEATEDAAARVSPRPNRTTEPTGSDATIDVQRSEESDTQDTPSSSPGANTTISVPTSNSAQGTSDISAESAANGKYAEGLEPFSIDGLATIPIIVPALTGAALEEVLSEYTLSCERQCTESLALGCALDNLTHERCVETCLFSVQNSNGFCVQEQLDRQLCQVAGGFACSNDRAQPLDTCNETYTPIGICQMELSCRSYCVAAIELGCTEFPDLSECVAACGRERDGFPERCHSDYEAVASCLSYPSEEKVCDDRRLFRIDNDCSDEAMRLGGCVFSETNNICESYCKASDYAGCGVGCRDRCARELTDADCGGDYLAALDCMLFFDDGVCVDGTMDAVDTICEGDWNAYLACVARTRL